MDSEMRRKIWGIEEKLRESEEFKDFLADYYAIDKRLVEVAQTMTEEQVDAVFDYLNLYHRLTEIMLEIALSK